MKRNLKIGCGNRFFIEFENTFRKLRADTNFYPKQIIIDLNGDRFDKKLFNYFQESNKDRITCVWEGINIQYKEDDIIDLLKVKNYTAFFDFQLMLNENVVLMVEIEENK